MSSLKGKEILLGIAGGIAAYKGVEVLRGLKRAGAEVQVIMTEHAQQFVTPLTFQTLSNRAVGTTLFELDRESRIGHIQMAEQADLALVAPCTANVLAKLRAGIGDDLLTTVLLACPAPLYLALAMNDNMLSHPATKENMEVIHRRGGHIIQPEVGFLAEGKVGPGRLAHPDRIVATIEAHFSGESGVGRERLPLAGKKVLVTAGPTVEVIDPVRYISNRSSGRMGFATAEVFRQAGAEVTLVTGPVRLEDPVGIETVRVTTAEEMAAAVMDKQPEMDVLILAAAVADFRMQNTEPHKIKKAGRSTLTLELEANVDIAASVGKKKKAGQVLVIFAAESQNLLENASKKLEAKKADLVVANDITVPGSGFESLQNRVTLVSKPEKAGGEPVCQDLPLLEKHAVAGHIVDRVAALLPRGK